MNIKGKVLPDKDLYEAILSLNSVEECRAFFEDICTISEINAMSQRLEVAKMLSKNSPYSEIVKATHASSATISRVGRCLNYGDGGYRLVLGKINNQND